MRKIDPEYKNFVTAKELCDTIVFQINGHPESAFIWTLIKLFAITPMPTPESERCVSTLKTSKTFSKYTTNEAVAHALAIISE